MFSHAHSIPFIFLISFSTTTSCSLKITLFLRFHRHRTTAKEEWENAPNDMAELESEMALQACTSSKCWNSKA
ncbi:hypothetical protein AQUCO_04400037v1 [Aquilegia coerulea]|uniref:Uncharacterized protein n=1 Tax=Aquilegia coerulea TaxID=218851 RepID=A0A2G5CMP7_AQUCA|nr:hypothetical protein AQUCO_04400037v1 [Aquilegia coerulea]